MTAAEDGGPGKGRCRWPGLLGKEVWPGAPAGAQQLWEGSRTQQELCQGRSGKHSTEGTTRQASASGIRVGRSVGPRLGFLYSRCCPHSTHRTGPGASTTGRGSGMVPLLQPHLFLEGRKAAVGHGGTPTANCPTLSSKGVSSGAQSRGPGIRQWPRDIATYQLEATWAPGQAGGAWLSGRTEGGL